MADLAMTYEALASRLGIAIPSARRLVLRKRWRKTTGNDGRAIVHVPEDFLSGRLIDDPPTVPPIDPEAVVPIDPETAVLQAKVTMLLERIAELRTEIDRERGERHRERERSDRLARELADLMQRRPSLLSWLKRW